MSRFRFRYAGLAIILSILAGSLGSFAVTFESTGLVQPIWEATLAPTVLGRVESIDVKESDMVEAGDLLMSLENDSEQLDADRRKIVADNTVEIELARAKLELLLAEFEGTKRIYESSGSISKEEFERTRLDLKLAEAELKQLEERKKVEWLDWKLAEEEVSKRLIRAPQAGVVVEIFPKVGEVCEPRQPLLKLVDIRTVRITLDVDVLRTAGLSAGVEVPVVVEGPEGDIAVTGSIDFVSPVVDGGSGLRRIRVAIENTDGKILPGLPARVMLVNSQ